ncbi:MAG: DNA repair protein RecO, partial [Candidatus Hydrogenedentota bacterium]
MSVEKSEAIVLHTYNLTESSKIVVLLTPLKGKVRAVGKGVRRAKSKFGSALEPITHIEVQIHFKEGRELQTLSQAETRESFPSIRSDLSRLGLALVMCELMEQFVQENEESSRPFVLLLLSLKTLESMS